MSIDANSFFSRKATQYGYGSSHSTFGNIYLTSVNNTLTQLYSELDLSSDPDSITDLTTDIDIDDDYNMVFEMGVDYWIVRLTGHSGDLDLRSAFAGYQDALRNARLRRDLDARDAATDGQVIAELDD
jgi:hypothetical protein